MVSLFTEKTYIENKTFCKENNIPCLYSSAVPITPTIPEDQGLFVIEADVSTNQVRGIGYIKNRPQVKSLYKTDDSKKHNGYIYVGKLHIPRPPVEDILFQLLDALCFYGKTHLKRYTGIQRFPQKWLNNLRKRAKYDMVDILWDLASRRAAGRA